ncbi:MAG: ribonuclease HII [Akkermansiaceae bacterium]|jgi:ribonuclease HII|nr:ribonuclease HII [Akkermansiaceae bacterium]
MPDLSLEDALHEAGWHPVAGIDEAGRGPLAGPVAAAAVMLPPGFSCPGLDDSKKLTPAKREALYAALTGLPGLHWALGWASVGEIETLNILRATHLAMRRAAEGLAVAPAHCLIDGLPLPSFPLPHTAVVKGDSRSLSIAAASIIAKVSRDRVMREIDQEFPQYGFAQHQGYGTAAHLAAIRVHGPCRHHRRSFQPIAQLALPFD